MAPEGRSQRLRALWGGSGLQGLVSSGLVPCAAAPPAGNLFPPLSSRAGRAPLVLCPGPLPLAFLQVVTVRRVHDPSGHGCPCPAWHSLAGEAWVCRRRVCRVRAVSKATALMWVACDSRRSVAPEAAFLSVTQLVLAPLFLKSRKVNLITGG